MSKQKRWVFKIKSCSYLWSDWLMGSFISISILLRSGSGAMFPYMDDRCLAQLMFLSYQPHKGRWIFIYSYHILPVCVWRFDLERNIHCLSLRSLCVGWPWVRQDSTGCFLIWSKFLYTYTVNINTAFPLISCIGKYILYA